MSIPITRLLVSVRSAEEAEAALAGGADIIDVKEPTRGPLGRADATTIADVVATVRGRAPVSVALGDWYELLLPHHLPHVTWAKLGFRNADASVLAQVGHLAEAVRPAQFIPVAYADSRRVHAPSCESVIDMASQHSMAALLIDTAVKDGRGLLHWFDVKTLQQFTLRCRHAGLFLALAGSLSLSVVKRLMDEVQPDIIAVRGAACEDGVRNGRVNAEAVAALVEVIQAGSPV